MTFKIISKNPKAIEFENYIKTTELDYKKQAEFLPIEDELAFENAFIVFEKYHNYMKYTSLPWFIISNKENIGIEEAQKRLDKIWTKEMLTCYCENMETAFRAFPTGDLNAKYILIGEAPGCKGLGINGFKRIFVFTRTSQILRQALIKNNMYHKCYFTNIAWCGFKDNKSGSDEQYQSCFKKHIDIELEMQKNADFIILAGKKSTEMFEKYFNTTIDINRINLIEIKNKTYKVISIYHPSYCLYSGISMENYAEHIYNKITSEPIIEDNEIPSEPKQIEKPLSYEETKKQISACYDRGAKYWKPIIEGERALAYDIETDSLNVSTAKMKFFGAYSWHYKKKYFLQYPKDKDKIRKLLEEHNVLITFNGLDFDNNVLTNNNHFPIKEILGEEKYNSTLKWKKENGREAKFFPNEHPFFKAKVQLDYYKIISPKFKGRVQLIKTKKGQMRLHVKNFKLDTIGKFLLNKGKEEFNLSILQKDELTQEEITLVKTYLDKDIELTKELHEWMENYFSSFKELISPDDIAQKYYISDRIAVLAYRAICYNCNLPFLFPDKNRENELKHFKFEGGFFSEPTIETFVTDGKNRVIVLDIKSAYNHAIRSMNLLSPVTPDYNGPIFSGNVLFPVKGKYKADKPGIIETKLTQWFMKRLKLKEENNPSEFAYKTILNVIFGITSNPVFISVFVLTCPGDTTLFCRQIMDLTIKKFTEAGFVWIYTATDSGYFIDKYCDDKLIEKLIEEIRQEVFKNVPFPQNSFSFELETPIKYLQFFKDSEGKLLANNYLYVNEKNEFKFKGMDFNDANSTALSKKIIEQHLIPEIVKNLNCKFEFDYIKKLIIQHIKEDISLMARDIRVGMPESYNSKTCAEYKIARTYGEGTHSLIPNRIFGAGTSIKFCTIEEFKERKLKIDDLILDKLFGELHYFIKDFKNFNYKKIDIGQSALSGFFIQKQNKKELIPITLENGQIDLVETINDDEVSS